MRRNLSCLEDVHPEPDGTFLWTTKEKLKMWKKLRREKYKASGEKQQIQSAEDQMRLSR